MLKTTLFHGTEKHFFPLLSLLILLLLFLSISSYIHLPYSAFTLSILTDSTSEMCTGRYIYAYDLPDKFNSDIVRDCRNLLPWHHMCPSVSNMGLGPRVRGTGSVLTAGGWHFTNQWVLDFIFHNRMKQYGCLTSNSSQADAIFVPYYAGLDTGRRLWNHNITERDLLLVELFDFLRSRPEWLAKGGRDHFLLSGRTTWDFRRQGDDSHLWGGKLLTLPEVKNMTVLLIESCPWGNENEFAIPYPTNFHPSKGSQVLAWQEKVRSVNRQWLFSFVGARRPDQVLSIRDQVVGQCLNSTRCNLLDCASPANDCNSPNTIMSLFERSTFCLEPPGDSPTRRSIFDAMLAGCIPVFFNPHSAYTQYRWYLPTNYTEYSVYIPEDDVREGRVRIEQVLSKYNVEQIGEMKDTVIRLIPTLIYKDPSHKTESVRDAFDVAIDGVLGRVKSLMGA
ncbi:hypothetical protein LUZ61_013118 [Rhynchospora tenuis]|uniref:Exostosin GT47 domain-containing protein n=1 Tax=Rhynchospora tenuis TaxID=198213 RepID=A0AAD5W906_9POAL|nr:hypothetical protein LUZ61_013118 [Rhynchospora tenuis]